MWNNGGAPPPFPSYIFPEGVSPQSSQVFNGQLHPPQVQVGQFVAPMTGGIHHQGGLDHPGSSLAAAATSVLVQKRPRDPVEDKAQKSRERNRMHARKTRQRKKIQMRMLRSKVEELEKEQRRLKQALDDRKTANVLLAMSASPAGCNTQLIDVEVLNDDDNTLNATTSTTAYGDSNSMDSRSMELGSENRSEEDEDDGELTDSSSRHSSSRHSEDPQKGGASSSALEDDSMHSKEDSKLPSTSSLAEQKELLQSESDLALKLLNKNKDFCTPQELEFLRRERNRLHAQRTRDRKKVYMEETEVSIAKLEEENRKLRESIQKLGTFSLVLPVRPPVKANNDVSEPQLIFVNTEVAEPGKAAAQPQDQANKNSDTQSDTNSESESSGSLEPRSSSSNGNGSSRSDDSNSVDDDTNGNSNGHEYHSNNDDINGNGSGSSAAEEAIVSCS